ncbi:unnamed protein product [Schistocephalus solidus]|uniref:C2H2-type domain-containing protein n=1 Tax=Schistocephalus solidus TaxID=70667 RepID=A0A183T7B1_SCHSO|nr:unnamed protein product [Schistocephalus solidus]
MTVKTKAAIYEAYQIATTKTKRLYFKLSSIATTHSHHVSAWSVTCKSIVQGLMNQCPEHQHTAKITASTDRTVLAHSLIVCAYMTAEFTAIPKTPTPCTPFNSAILPATATLTKTNDIHPASPDFSCPHCARNFNSCIGLVGHL